MRFRVRFYEPRTATYEIEADNEDAAYDAIHEALARESPPQPVEVEVHDQAIMSITPVDGAA